MDKSNRRPQRRVATNTASASNEASSSGSQPKQPSSSSEDLPILEDAWTQPSQTSTSRRSPARPVRPGKKRKQIPPTDSEHSEDEPRSKSGAASQVAHLADGQKRPKTAETRQTSSSSASAQQDGPQKPPSRIRLSPPKTTAQREPAPRQAGSSSGSEIEIVPSQRSSQTPKAAPSATNARRLSQRSSLPTSSRPSSTTNVPLPATPTIPIRPPSPPPEVPIDQLRAVLANTLKYLIIQGPEIFSDRQAFSKMTDSARDLMNRTSDDMELAIYRTEFEEKENQLKQSDRDLENKIAMLVEPVLETLTEVVRRQSQAQLKLKSKSEITKLHAIIDSQAETISTNDARWTAFEQRVASLDAKLASLGPQLETTEGMESRLTKLEESMNKSNERILSLSDKVGQESSKQQDTRWEHRLANTLDSAQAQCRQHQEAQFTSLQSKLAELDTSLSTRLDNRLDELATQQARWANDEVQSIKAQLKYQKQAVTNHLDRLGAKLAEIEGDHQSQLDQLKSQVAGAKQASTEISRPSVGPDDLTAAEPVTEESHAELVQRVNSLDERVSHLLTGEDVPRPHQQSRSPQVPSSRDSQARSSVENTETIRPKGKRMSPGPSAVSPNGYPGNAAAVRSQRPVPASSTSSCAQPLSAPRRSSLEPNATLATHSMPHEAETFAAIRAGFSHTELGILYNYMSRRLMTSTWLTDMVKSKVMDSTKDHSTWLADMVKSKVMDSTKEFIPIIVAERLTNMGLFPEKVVNISRITEKLLGFEPDMFVRKVDPGYLKLLSASSELFAIKGLRDAQESVKVQQEWMVDRIASIDKLIGPVENGVRQLVTRMEFAETAISHAISINQGDMATLRREFETMLAATQQKLEQVQETLCKSPSAHHDHLEPALDEGDSAPERSPAGQETQTLSLPTIESHIADCLIKYSDPTSPALSSRSEREEGEEDELEDEARAVDMCESDARRAKWIMFFKRFRECNFQRDEKVTRLQVNLDQYATTLVSITEIIKQAVGGDFT